MKRISKTEIKEMRSQSKKNSIMFAFTLPTVILYTIFFLVTMLIGVYYSFTDWNGISKDYTFVGLKNYVKVLTDERFREALWFNIGYTIALVVLLIVIPGKPDYRQDFGRMKLDSWHVTHQEVPQFAKLKGHSYLDGQYLSLSCADFAEMYTGHHLWNNYRVTAVLKPVTGTEHFVNIRVQGAMRSYAAGFSKNNKLVLRKNYYGYTTLCETDFEWKVDEEYKISLTADGSTISVSVNDKEYLKFTDSDLPLLTGCAGISVEKGSHCLYRDIAITGRE